MELYVLDLVRGEIQIYFEDQIQNQLTFSDITSFSMKISVKPPRSYDLRHVMIVIPDQMLNAILGLGIRIKFYVDGNSMYFQMLGQEEKKTIQAIYPVSSFIMSYTQQAYSILKASFVSYFLLDVISFWNLSLMYNFLPISTVPLFSKYFLQKLQTILFKLNNILSWLMSKAPQLSPYFDFTEAGGRQLIQQYENSYAWFGSYGISSRYANNNIQQIGMIGVLVVKLGVLVALRKVKLLPRVVRRRLPRGLRAGVVFLNQVIGMQIFMIVSATSYIGKNQKINSILQIFTLFSGIILIPLYFLSQLTLSKQKILKKSHHPHPHPHPQNPSQSPHKPHPQKPLRSTLLTLTQTLLEYIPFFTIPFLITFNNVLLYLGVNSLVLGVRIWWVCKYMRVFCCGRREKVFMGFNLVFWALHHFGYVGFWVVEKLVDGYGDTGWARDAVKIIGFITIFTVILGGVFQFINFALSVIVGIFKLLKQFFLTIKKSIIKNFPSSPTPINPTNPTNPNPPSKHPPKKQLIAVNIFQQHQSDNSIIQKLNWNRVRILVQLSKQKLKIKRNGSNRVTDIKKIGNNKRIPID